MTTTTADLARLEERIRVFLHQAGGFETPTTSSLEMFTAIYDQLIRRVVSHEEYSKVCDVVGEDILSVGFSFVLGRIDALNGRAIDAERKLKETEVTLQRMTEVKEWTAKKRDEAYGTIEDLTRSLNAERDANANANVQIERQLEKISQLRAELETAQVIVKQHLESIEQLRTELHATEQNRDVLAMAVAGQITPSFVKKLVHELLDGAEVGVALDVNRANLGAKGVRNRTFREAIIQGKSFIQAMHEAGVNFTHTASRAMCERRLQAMPESLKSMVGKSADVQR